MSSYILLPFKDKKVPAGGTQNFILGGKGSVSGPLPPGYYIISVACSAAAITGTTSSISLVPFVDEEQTVLHDTTDGFLLWWMLARVNPVGATGGAASAPPVVLDGAARKKSIYHVRAAGNTQLLGGNPTSSAVWWPGVPIFHGVQFQWVNGTAVAGEACEISVLFTPVG